MKASYNLSSVRMGQESRVCREAVGTHNMSSPAEGCTKLLIQVAFWLPILDDSDGKYQTRRRPEVHTW